MSCQFRVKLSTFLKMSKSSKFNFNFSLVLNDFSKKIIKIVLECVILVVTALIGYYGGNAVM